MEFFQIFLFLLLMLLVILFSEEIMEPLIWILDTSYEYGNEFYGSNVGVAITPVSERCFLTMSQALGQCQGTCFIGPTDVGKTENVKVR